MGRNLQLPALETLIDLVHSLPGIGRRTAERIAYHIVEMDDSEIDRMIGIITDAKKTIHKCKICGNFTDKEICGVCSDETRDKSIMCVVEKSKDVISFEMSGELHCSYHVLHALLRPSDFEDDSTMRIDQLIGRIRADNVKEVILATDFSVYGEATASYISKRIKPLGVKVTRLGTGISVGTKIQVADTMTLAKSLQSRSEI